MMLSWFVVKERSMEPFCRDGDFVLVNRMSYFFSRPKVGQVVVLEDPKDFSRLVLKRVTAVQGSFLWVEGDNKERSTDSRDFGWVRAEALLGPAKVIHKTASLDRSIMNK